MAYAGYLFKIGTFTVPFNMIFTESYKVTKNDQDVDSYRDANGKLHRNALSNWAFKCEWEIPPMKKHDEIETFFNNIYSQLSLPEKKGTGSFYVPELRGYFQGDVYLNSSVEFPMYRATPQFIQYGKIRVAFIGYGATTPITN